MIKKLQNPGSSGPAVADLHTDVGTVLSRVADLPRARRKGNTYFVIAGESGTIGNNANDGLTWDTAWATITYALTQAVDWDTIYVSPGSNNATILEGATLNITQDGLRLFGVQSSGHQWGFPSIHTHGTETLITINAHEVEIAYLGFHQQGAGHCIEIGPQDNAWWRTHIHDCYFGGNGTALWGIVLGNTNTSGVGSESHVVDAPCSIVEDCYFGFFVAGCVFMNCGYGSVVRRCTFNLGYVAGSTACEGIRYYTNTASRPFGYILDNRFSTATSTTLGINVAQTPSAGYLMIDGNRFVNFTDDDTCCSKRTGYFGVNYNNDVQMTVSDILHSMDFWSDPVEEVSVDGDAGTLAAMATVTVADLPTGATIVRAIAMMKFRSIENTNAAANKLDGATVDNTSQVIQVADDTPGTYYDAIKFVDDQFGLAGSTREGGDVLIGSVDIAGAGKVDANDGYIFRWLLSNADQDDLNFNDVQFGLRIWYSV